jgi:uncharacterized protein (TIGR00290 family)
MRKITNGLQADGFTVAAFGDIFLEDLRRYREEKLASVGLTAVFPLWKRDTRELMHEFIDLGFRAIVVCVSLKNLDASFVGRELSREFLRDLPTAVDPCGENGEFHTFCFAGPIFRQPIAFQVGEVAIRNYPSPDGGAAYEFAFQDLIAH